MHGIRTPVGWPKFTLVSFPCKECHATLSGGPTKFAPGLISY